jgi:hypothetical protein
MSIMYVEYYCPDANGVVAKLIPFDEINQATYDLVVSRHTILRVETLI